MGFGAFKPAGPMPAAPAGRAWAELMEIALAEARKAAQAGEIPVGALVVDPHGEILAKAANEVERRDDPTAHAEMLALRLASRRIGNCRLKDCVLVCTLEPCLMCAGAMLHSRVAGIVYGAADARAGAIASQADLPNLPGASHFIWHMGGMLSDECARILRDFFQARRP